MAISKKRKKKNGVRIIGDAKLVAEAMKDMAAGFAESPGKAPSGLASVGGGSTKMGQSKGYAAASYAKDRKLAAKKKPPAKKPPVKKKGR